MIQPEGASTVKTGLTPGPSSNGRQISSNLVKSRQMSVKCPSGDLRALRQIRQFVKLKPSAGPSVKSVKSAAPSGPLCQIRETTGERVMAMSCQSVDVAGSYIVCSARELTEVLL